jgi:hypothetical protein
MSALTDTKPLLPIARGIVIEARRGSISLVQRHLQIGYNAAAELLETLEAEGTVGPIGSDGDYGRKVLVPRESGQNQAMPKAEPKRPPGRPPVADKDRLRVGTIRLTRAQWDKLAALGGAEWVRKKIDVAKVPSVG